MNRGRRIYFDVGGEVVVDTGEAMGDVLPFPAYGSIEYIDLAYGQEAENFARALRYHVDPVTRQVVFDELAPVDENSSEEFADDAENQLLISEGVI